MNWIDAEFLNWVCEWVSGMPMLTVAGAALGVAFGLLSYAREQRDLRVLSLCAFAYALMPVLPML